jgi:phosphopantothenoylcysteine decarboxylase / phosphopantothenate---cysteine ligase
MSRILLGVSGGIAAYKALEFVRLATAAGHAVRVVQTPTSLRFVGEASFAALTGAPVLSDEFERDPARGAFPGQTPPAHEPLSHLELVANADLYLIAPASANTLAKLAHGLADNLLCTSALAATCPVVVAPAMNNAMYEHAATQANLRILRERGVHVIEPDVGRLASKGEEGIGRLAEPALLLEECEGLLEEAESGSTPTAAASGEGAVASSWSRLNVLITAGGTREPIDSVRFLGNCSSGRMGLALAQAARARGAQVTVVAANVALPRPPGVAWREAPTASQLQAACEEEFPACDVLLMAAAVADFRPVASSNGKIKKAGQERLRLELEATPDVLCGLAAQRREGQTLVGFAAEHGAEALEYGRGKLKEKCLDAVVVNDISRADIGFQAPDNEVTIVTVAGERHIPRAGKDSVAESILDAVAALRAGA